VQRVVEEPIPYFSQLRCCPKPSGATKQSEQQDLSAARLEDIASEGHHPLPHPHIPPASQSHHSDKGTPTVQSKLDVEAQIGSIPSIQEEVPTDTTDLDAVIKQYDTSQDAKKIKERYKQAKDDAEDKEEKKYEKLRKAAKIREDAEAEEGRWNIALAATWWNPIALAVTGIGSAVSHRFHCGCRETGE